MVEAVCQNAARDPCSLGRTQGTTTALVYLGSITHCAPMPRGAMDRAPGS